MITESPFFNIVSKEIEWAGAPLTLEVGRIARRALGAVTVYHRDTVILCTVCAGKEVSFGGGVPLSVYYQEKFSSAGRIPGGFVKREGKPSEYETLVSRYIDRMLRPSFLKGFSHEVQVVCTVLSYDTETDPGVLSMIGASAAVAISGLPIQEISSGVRVGYKNGQFTLNTPNENFDVLMGATPSGPSMIECQATSCTEEFILEALRFGHQALHPVFEGIHWLKDNVKSPHHSHKSSKPEEFDFPNELQEELDNACQVILPEGRHLHLEKILSAWKTLCEEHGKISLEHAESYFYEKWKKTARTYIIEKQKRLDGRRWDEIRPIFCEVGLLPRCHGSALFTRGHTQALVTVTLGSRQDDSQMIERLSGIEREYFMLHYSFPPYAVGEVGKMFAPGRREIGHGRLAQKALVNLLPKDLSCTVRLASEITESYGSSSMATVCGASIALMDAGIRLKAPVAGIAMGLISKNSSVEEDVVLWDISGTEDFLGDMDFKVAGTEQGITALQVDLKINTLSFGVIERTLAQAKIGRLHILKTMEEQTISVPRDSVSIYAPRVSRIKIPVDKIRDLVGPGGKNIKHLCDISQSKIDIGEDGQVSIFSYRAEDAECALKAIKNLTQGPIVGNVYDGVVKKLLDFGAFVNFGFPQDGLVHVTEILAGKRLTHPSEQLKEGQSVQVRVLDIDKSGKVQLSIRQA
ncbi:MULTISPECIES: polyribonucleotide nucleotidyltransferase [Holospora]|uniref:Polyribonucleotide nucleotidyltransferase n=2 Tax=Holospora TaxID=44747 RepID=A0A061JG95_9PROT|nr:MULTISPECIES: polyribonucleotide nucleotidyltransferase [Holospora]ETZ04915.1 polyribonucleotide nucleotidyltransferase [Holospora undulata HU1]GAJ46520.1 polyribonucleotide nucleotidyltransferase [Holospora elegans E1]